MAHAAKPLRFPACMQDNQGMSIYQVSRSVAGVQLMALLSIVKSLTAPSSKLSGRRQR